MAQGSYVSTYRTYKAGTNRFTTWLVNAARRCGVNVVPSGKHHVPLKEFVNLAKIVTQSNDPKIRIPNEVVALINSVITLRKNASKIFANLIGVSTNDSAHASHNHFNSILEQVLAILHPVVAIDPLTTSATASTTVSSDVDSVDIHNLFAALSIEDPANVDGDKSKASSGKTSKAKTTPEYEPETSDDDLLYVIIACLNDINDVRNVVQKAWRDYRDGRLDVMAAAVTTDTAYGVIRRICEDLEEAIPGTEKYSTMLLKVSEETSRIGDEEYGSVMSEVADWIALPSQRFLEDFADVHLQPYMLPVYKPGSLGVYDPKRDRTAMSEEDQRREDQLVLIEYLLEVTAIARLRMHVPAQDDLTAGLRVMMETCDAKSLPMYAVFAQHIFLDIHHILRELALHPFNELQCTAIRLISTVDDYFQLTGSRRIDSWPPQNDKALRGLKALAQEYVLEDYIGKLQIEAVKGVVPSPSKFLKTNPVACGLLVFRMNLLMQGLGSALCDAWGTVIYPIHLYNACRQSGGLQKTWEDAEYLYQIHTARRMLVGAPPTEPQEYLNRFLVCLGTSASILASNRRPGGRYVNVPSKKGPRGLRTTSPIKDIFFKRYVDDKEATLSHQNVTAMLHTAAKAQRLTAHGPILRLVASGGSLPTKFTPQELLICVREGMASEEMHLQLNYFELHQRGLQLMRTLKDAVNEDLVKYIGAGYIEDESQLPDVIGYIFQLVSESDRTAAQLRLANHGSRILGKASDVMREYLESESNSMDVRLKARALTRTHLYAHEHDALDKVQIWDPQRGD